MDYEKVVEAKIMAMLTGQFNIPDVLRENIISMIQYNAVGGKMIRGLFAVYSTYLLCDKWDTATKEQYE